MWIFIHGRVIYAMDFVKMVLLQLQKKWSVIDAGNGNISKDSDLSVVTCINSLWLNDVIWWHRSLSELAQVMAWCLMPPSHCLMAWSHYLYQCWHCVIKILNKFDAMYLLCKSFMLMVSSAKQYLKIMPWNDSRNESKQLKIGVSPYMITQVAQG